MHRAAQYLAGAEKLSKRLTTCFLLFTVRRLLLAPARTRTMGLKENAPRPKEEARRRRPYRLVRLDLANTWRTAAKKISKKRNRGGHQGDTLAAH